MDLFAGPARSSGIDIAWSLAMEHQEETTTLISGGKVSGTNVYNSAGESLGDIHDVMIDKVSGRVAYAVMSFGGFLGIGESYHPLPWSALTYDTNKGGYVVNLSREQLEGAPTYSSDSEPNWDRRYEQGIHDYYGIDPYWGGILPR
jgi:hypothetical protein